MNLQSPLYITSVGTDGKFMLGGIFKMQDQVGFPVDASFEECKEHGFRIDWLEALCDCWLNDCQKYGSFVRQAEMITGAKLHDMFATTGAKVLAMFPSMKNAANPVDEACRYVLKNKWDGSFSKSLNEA